MKTFNGSSLLIIILFMCVFNTHAQTFYNMIGADQSQITAAFGTGEYDNNGTPVLSYLDRSAGTVTVFRFRSGKVFESVKYWPAGRTKRDGQALFVQWLESVYSDGYRPVGQITETRATMKRGRRVIKFVVEYLKEENFWHVVARAN